jgi:UDP-3-O-[3-hydroxymyristoyl] glucosamine N-acyltransferase
MDANSLTWINKKNSYKIKMLNIGVVICHDNITEFELSENCVYILVSEPRLAFSYVLDKFFIEKDDLTTSIANTAVIDKDVKIGNCVKIGHNTIIESGSQIGSNVNIGHNNVIKKNTIIEDNVKIGSNNTIGGEGFGYEKNESGQYVFMPHLGNVHICKNVEIGNNTCVDRAVLGSTILRENCKIDNLVHIAHGVDIGENALIIANSMIAGSVTIGNNAWIAPSVSILNKIKIKNNAFIGMGAVVIKDVDENSAIFGNPGRIINRSR